MNNFFLDNLLKKLPKNVLKKRKRKTYETRTLCEGSNKTKENWGVSLVEFLGVDMNTSTPKWVPKHSQDILQLFQNCKKLEYEFRIIVIRFSTNINLDLLDRYELQNLVEDCQNAFALSETIQENLRTQIIPATSKKLQRSPYKMLLQTKATIMGDVLKKRSLQLLFVINKTIKALLDIVPQSEINIEAALILTTLYNETVDLTTKDNENKYSGTNLCSNTFPGLLLPQKKIDVGLILQILCKSRSEHCCLSLISCLLATSKIELQPYANDDAESNSSIEILRTLTSHLTSPTKHDFFHHISPIAPEQQSIPNVISENKDTIAENGNKLEFETSDPAIKFFDNMAKELLNKTKYGTDAERSLIKCDILQHLIMDEEAFIAHVIAKCCKMCPTAVIDNATKDKSDITKWINRGVRSLWTQIGSTLDHIVLWWSDVPLASRPPVHTKQLRDWLLALQPEDAPEPILSTLKGLGETLTSHVTNTMWDQQFRLALVSSTGNRDFAFAGMTNFKVYTTGSNCGKLWCEVINTLVSLCNSCDQNGTIPSQLPIVEQIPILHRLDHTIHSMRISAVCRARSQCAEWNMDMFFKIAHGDIRNCLENLHELRVPQLADPDSLEVLVQVCVALRSKLISETKANISKLKDTTVECIEILSIICKTFSLATLTLCFPTTLTWQNEYLQTECGEYVNYFLNTVYLPITKGTRDLDILMLTLKIICESWLDHIYAKKIKFSTSGALNLLKDFDGVADWIIECASIPNEHVDRLSKHEVLRMCEGVGKILLRKPEEIVSILPSPKYYKKNEDDGDDKPQLPPEMFVPNQKRWLELRVRNKKKINCLRCICSGIAVEN